MSSPYRPEPRALTPPSQAPHASWRRRLSAWWRGVPRRHRAAVHARAFELMLRAFDEHAYARWAFFRQDLINAGWIGSEAHRVRVSRLPDAPKGLERWLADRAGLPTLERHAYDCWAYNDVLAKGRRWALPKDFERPPR